MAASRRLRTLLFCACVTVASSSHAAQVSSSDGAYDWSADVLNSDFRSDTLDLSGNVRVTQGAMLIESEAATAKNFRADVSTWTFRDDVHIRTSQADLRSASAAATVVNGEISSARVEGAPALFEQRGEAADGQVRGRAGLIEYDLGAGVLRMTGDVWFSNGTDEFRGDVVIYDIREERVQINPPGESSGRVRGVIRPRAPASETDQRDVQNGNGA